MRIPRASVLIVLPLSVALLLAGCLPIFTTPPPGIPSTSEPSPSNSVSPTLTEPAPIEPALADDAVLVVSTTVTADNGAVLDLRLVVHRSTAWNDPVGAERAAMMTAACLGALDAGVYDANLWSFALVDVTATARDGAEWPAGHRLFLEPYSGYVSIASSGFPLDDDEVSAETPHCQRDKYLESAGSGEIVVGVAGDTDTVEAAGHFTKWANHNYGFVNVRVSSQTAADVGMSFSDCSYSVTDAGKELGGDAPTWHLLTNDTHCAVGSSQEQKDS
jgi:hypothetical protein